MNVLHQIPIVKPLIFLSIVFLLQGCIIKDLTKKYDKNICSVHNCKMKKGIVKMSCGIIDVFLSTLDNYPHYKPRFVRNCDKKHKLFAIIYYCPQCQKAKKAHYAGKEN